MSGYLLAERQWCYVWLSGPSVSYSLQHHNIFYHVASKAYTFYTSVYHCADTEIDLGLVTVKLTPVAAEVGYKMTPSYSSIRVRLKNFTTIRKIEYVCTGVHFKDLKRLEWILTNS
jgi:hypothetical protein